MRETKKPDQEHKEYKKLTKTLKSFSTLGDSATKSTFGTLSVTRIGFILIR